MNCIEFEAELENQVETRCAITLAAMEHASQCPECRVAWQIHQQLEVAIAAWQPVEGSSDLSDRVLMQLQMKDPGAFSNASVPASNRKFSVLVATVVCLLIVIVHLKDFSGNHSNQLAQRSPTTVRETDVSNPQLDVSETLSEVFSDLRSEYREIASETRSAAMDLVNRLPGQMDIFIPAERDDVVVPSTTNDVSRFWAPIGSRVETALGFLWQAVPAEIPSG